ncbi:MAG: Secretory immunoglobulin A-binding protein EsiB [Chlamydiae bacterium]|nr:Secretory immunoglobulin A-binding protein EsiB [Chlamydiota bacterium]
MAFPQPITQENIQITTHITEREPSNLTLSCAIETIVMNGEINHALRGAITKLFFTWEKKCASSRADIGEGRCNFAYFSIYALLTEGKKEANEQKILDGCSLLYDFLKKEKNLCGKRKERILSYACAILGEYDSESLKPIQSHLTRKRANCKNSHSNENSDLSEETNCILPSREKMLLMAQSLAIVPAGNSSSDQRNSESNFAASSLMLERSSTRHIVPEATKLAQSSISKIFISQLLIRLRKKISEAVGKGQEGELRDLFQHEVTRLHQRYSSQPTEVWQFCNAFLYVLSQIDQENRVEVCERFFLSPTTGIWWQLRQRYNYKEPLQGRCPGTSVYRERLKDVRKEFLEISESDVRDVREVQRQRSEKIRDFYRMLIDDTFEMMENPPLCRYDVRVMGSIAREESSPYSDIEYFILVEEPEKGTEEQKCERLRKNKEYFKHFAQILDFQIISLGETDSQLVPLPKGLLPGLQIDIDGNPALEGGDSLISTPKEFAQGHPTSQENTDKQRFKCHLFSMSLKQRDNSLFEECHYELTKSILEDEKRKEFAASLIKIRLDTFSEKSCLPESCEIKNEFINPLFHLLGEIGLYYGSGLDNTLDCIEHLPLFDDQTKDLLKEAVGDLYRIRVRIHTEAGGMVDKVPYELNEKKIELSSEEKGTLERIHCLIIAPLHGLGAEKLLKFASEGRELNLIEIAWEELLSSGATARAFGSLVKHTASFLQLHGGSFNDHKQYYLRLANSTSFECLQEKYLEGLEAIPGTEVIVKVLANLSNIGGFRQQAKRVELELIEKIKCLVTSDTDPDNDRSDVKVESPFLDGNFYLKSNFKNLLIGRNGHLNPHKDYKGKSLHTVTRAQADETTCLHFKEFPYQPLMEYAVFSFMWRIMGEATPPSSLVRFKIGDISYPVLITKTIEGKTLHEANAEDIKEANAKNIKSLDRKHLTWFKLCEILLKIADGRPSNYVLKNGLVFGVDNDIAFCNPLQRGGFFQSLRVRFGSSLFLLGNEKLNKLVLEEFCLLNPQTLLQNWLEDIEEREKKYLNFFPDKEKKYAQGEEMRFILKFLVPKGAITALWLQFRNLQDFIRSKLDANLSIHSLDLFDSFITLDHHKGYEQKQLGSILKKSYSSAMRKEQTLTERFCAVTSAPMSMTSLRAQEACFGGELTYQETQKRVFSIEEVKQELSFLNISEEWIQVGDVQGFSKDVVMADFKSVRDLQRQKKILDALELYLDNCKKKPTTLILRNCAVIEWKTLSRILKKMNLQKIEQLDLEGSPRITNFHGSFPKLRCLNLSRCKNLTTMQVTSDLLTKLNVSHSTSLRSVTLKVTPEILDIEWENTPHFNKKTLDYKWFTKNLIDLIVYGSDDDVLDAMLDPTYSFGGDLGDRYAAGVGVLKNKDTAAELWRERAAKGDVEGTQKLAQYHYEMGKFQQAVQLWSKISSHPEAQYSLGACLYYGEGVEQNRKEAIELWKKSAEKKHPIARALLSFKYHHGEDGLHVDKMKAISYWKSIASSPPFAKLSLALVEYRDSKNLQKFSEQISFWEKSVKEHPVDAYITSWRFFYPRDVESELERACQLWENAQETVVLKFPREFYTKAKNAYVWAEEIFQEDPVAFCALGLSFHFGEGVQRNEEKALELFRSSARMGHPYAKKMVACYASLETPESFSKEESLNLWKEAAEGGDSMAQFIVGCHFFYGEDRDEQRAIGLWESSVVLGDPIAKCVLGQRYYLGDVVVANHERAIELWDQG